MQNPPYNRQDLGEFLDFPQSPHSWLHAQDHLWIQPELTYWPWGPNSCWLRMRRETREYMGKWGICSLLAQQGLFSLLPSPVLRLLHLFAARGLRWAAYAAAEVLQMYRHLDIREHKGKVRIRGSELWILEKRAMES